jgi:serine/threonine protein kinase/DNA-binding beta-propeller fold protein YncE
MIEALEPGAIFAGHRIEAELGRGGMAVVYRARHLALDRVRALKILAPELSADAVYAARFRRESRLAAAIEHPNVVAVHHAGEEDGRLYLVMRYVDGVDLARMLADGPLRPERAVSIVAGLAAGLDAAHAVGLIHRDVKPANALIEGEGEGERVYLTDFGISKLLAPDEPLTDASGARLTSAGAILGTADYMAPEQIDGAELDARADVYSLACLAFHALTGEPPFARPTTVATLAAHGTAPRPSAAERRTGLSAQLDRTLARGMAIDPAGRPASAGELAAELRQALGAIGTAAAPPTPASGGERPSPAPDPSSSPTAPLPSRHRSRPSPLVLALAGTLFAAALAGLLLLLLAGEEDPSSGDAPAGAVSASIPVARGPVALSAGPDSVWVASRNADRLRAIDPALDEQAGPRLAAAKPRSVAVGFGSVWVLEEGTLLRFGAGEADEPGDSDPVVIGGFEDPSDVAVDRRHVWVTDRGPQGRVLRIDPEQNTITGEAAVGRDPRAVATGNGSVWVANAGDSSVIEVDADDARTLARPIPIGTRPTDLAVGPDAVWVIDNIGGTLTRIDLLTGLADEPIATGARPRGVTLGYGSVWVAAGGLNGSVWRYEQSDGTRIGEPIRVGEDPADIDAAAGSIWTADYIDSTVTRIEP